MRTRTLAVIVGLSLMMGQGMQAVVHAEQFDPQPLRTAVRRHAVRDGHLLEQSARRARLPGRTCKARVCAGAALGAGAGAVFGALITNGNRTGAAIFGAFLFSLIGAGVGYKSCGP